MENLLHPDAGQLVMYPMSSLRFSVAMINLQAIKCNQVRYLGTNHSEGRSNKANVPEPRVLLACLSALQAAYD